MNKQETETRDDNNNRNEFKRMESPSVHLQPLHLAHVHPSEGFTQSQRTRPRPWRIGEVGGGEVKKRAEREVKNAFA